MDITESIFLVALVKNIYTLWGLICLLRPYNHNILPKLIRPFSYENIKLNVGRVIAKKVKKHISTTLFYGVLLDFRNYKPKLPILESLKILA